MNRKEPHKEPEKSDFTSFEALFDQYYDLVKNYIYYKTGDLPFSEDLAQDVFLRIWEVRENIDEKTVQNYIFRIARNMLINQKKRERVSFNFIQKQPQKSEAETPEFMLEYKQFDEKLRIAIENLPEKQRVVFLMNRIDKLTYVEIARFLRLSVKAVEKRMHGALKYLRGELKVKL